MDTQRLHDTAEWLKVLAHPVRRCICRLWHEGECNVSYMQGCLSMPQSTISQHLAKRRVAHIIEGTRNGLEVSYHLKEPRVVSLLECLSAAPHILAPFDTDMTLIGERKLNAHGIGIILGDSVQSFEKQADGTLVAHSQKGKTLPANFVIVSSEIQPDTDLLNESGIALGNRGTHAGQRISPDKYTRHLCRR